MSTKKKARTTGRRPPLTGMTATITFSPELLAYIAKHYYCSEGYATEEGVREWLTEMYENWKREIDARPTLEEAIASATWQARETKDGAP